MQIWLMLRFSKTRLHHLNSHHFKNTRHTLVHRDDTKAPPPPVQSKSTMAEAEPIDDLEPLFDYHRVQPLNIISLDDDDDSTPAFSPKRRKVSDHAVEKIDKKEKAILVADSGEEEEDWLPPPPKVSVDAETSLGEDSTLKELRLKKQELASFAQSAEKVLRAVEESAKRDLSGSLDSPLKTMAEKPTKPHAQRAKIVISVQDKDEQKQFRIYKDEKFERLFKMYAEKVKRDLQSLVFSFDGARIKPTETPKGLDMEDEDIIEVHVK